MSVVIFLFSKKNLQIEPKLIQEFFEEGAYWDRKPKYVSKVSTDGFEMQVRYDPKKKPFLVSFYANDHETFLETKQEILEVLEEEPKGGKVKKIVEWIEKSVQMFAINVDPASIREEDWSAVDSLEAFLARESAALIYSSGEFFEVKDLIRKIYSFRNGSY
ncbi:hypothetical protein JWG44_22005 [Leptospira sp. 201903071]|uniref:hypothetical protein n=1 Tax=Leptospira ainazelensis TaxID=2810034 RepID=UPI001962304C|nr:hypothetical protein [Leptospira ainazelensis]MBM9502930.1 hypothetical protein [Leptospira ainazelensis]